MVVSSRERYIAAIAIAVLVLLALDRVVLGPLVKYRKDIDARKSALAAEISRTEDLAARNAQDAPLWKAMRASLQPGPAEAESQILHAVRDWAEDARLTLSLVKPERLVDKSRLPQIAFQTVGTGSMEAVSRFIWRLETARIPIKITELQLASRKEGTDDLNVTMRISTVYLPERKASAAAKPTQGAETKK